jgi:hypothetical protein
MEVRGSYAGGEYESDLDFLNIEERDGDGVLWLLD